MTNKFSKFKIILFFLIFLSGFLGWQKAEADTHIVSSDCSSTAVQAAINAASEGDIIDVTCIGMVDWSSQIILSGGKTLKGGGKKGLNGADGNWPLTINVTYDGYLKSLIKVVNDNSQPVNRVSGFKFSGTGAPTYIIGVSGRGTGIDGKGAFRIDNNYFDQVLFGSGGRLTATDGTTGKMTGLFDHNVFYYIYPAGGNNSYVNSYKGSSGTCYGYDAWQRETGFGTDDFVFWEDNYMFNNTIETSGGGGKVVVRHNQIISSSTHNDFAGLDGHGADTGGHHACGIVADEFYSNTITGQNAYSQVVDMRGGKWMVFNNTTESGRLQINEYRVSGPQYIEWKVCNGTFCCPTTPPQCEIQAPTASDFAACYPLLNQVRDTFVWNNLKNGVNMIPQPVGGTGGLVDIYVALNRDYWMPAYGLEADLPETCIDDDDTFYGATDSGKLWECTAANTWTLKYEPYVYPHPLRSGDDVVSPAAPSGLSVQ